MQVTALQKLCGDLNQKMLLPVERQYSLVLFAKER